MARAVWKGAIEFGLVTIPVKLYLATEAKSTVSFHLLHAPDLARIQMKIWCPQEGRIVERGETVRGYEYAPGRYVVISDEDLAGLPLKTVHTIAIEQFVRRDEMAPRVRFVRQAYYLEPDPIGRKAFVLLRQVLAEEDLMAVCKVAIKDREALAALDPYEETMLLATLFWPDEVRSTADLDLPHGEVEIRPAELTMARQLVAAMTRPFDPAAYRDEYREALMRVIEAKVAGAEEAAPAATPVPTGTLIDLMAALEASVAAARAGAAPVVAAEAARRTGRPARRAGSREETVPAPRKTAEAGAPPGTGAGEEGRAARRRKTA